MPDQPTIEPPDTLVRLYKMLRDRLVAMEQENPALPKQAGYSLGVSDLDAINSIYQATQATKPEGLIG